jgi:asparagine synthase (glutamine-hydrolysing)
MKIAETASEHVTVLLSGAGADELFAGYGHYSLTRKKEWYARAQLLHRIRAIDRLLDDPRSPGALEALKRYRDSRLEWHFENMSSLSAIERSDLRKQIPGSANPAAALASAFSEADGIGPLNQQLYADLRTYLPGQLLPVLDRSTMSASIEGRVPFLDHRLVEAAFAVRGSEKLGVGGKPKAILHQLGSGHLPPRVLSRPKHGFPNSVLEWFDAGLANALPAILSRPSGLAIQHLPRPWVQALTKSPATMRKNWRVLYSLLVLEIWYELLINRELHSAPTASLEDLFNVRVG